MKNRCEPYEFVLTLLLTLLMIFALMPVLGLAADNNGEITVDLNSGASRDGNFIAANSTFSTGSGKSRKLFMTGLKDDNKDEVLDCLSVNFDSVEAGTPIKIIDNAFSDAEKWNNTQQNYDDSQYEGDSLQCWAASTSNMLWISGWTQYLDTGAAAFTSEDDIFRLYTDTFTDRGSNADRAIDWFFTGEYFLSGFEEHAAFKKPEQVNRINDGFKKAFVSSLAQKQYDIVDDAFSIEALTKTGPASGEFGKGQSVFCGDIGTLDDGEFYKSHHTITIAGIITDPDAEEPVNRYKAIIIIDSDNDGSPDENEKKQVSDGTATRGELKAARPNSYTVYPLAYITDKNGVSGWQLVGYGITDNEIWTIYDIDELPLPSESLINSCTETEGSMDPVNDPDFTLDNLFMTTSETGYKDPFWRADTQERVTEFEYGAAVRLNFFVANRSYKNIINYEDDKTLKLNWVVTSDKDGSVIAQGSNVCELPLLAGYDGGSEKANLVTLNDKAGVIEAWKPGKYTLTANINRDRSVSEAYYINNFQKDLHFTIKEKKESGDKPAGQDSVQPSGSGTDKKSVVTKSANPLKVNGKTIRVRYKRLKKKTLILKAKSAYRFRNRGKGTRTYKKISVNKYSKRFTVNRKTGKITVKKGTKKGIYKIKVRVKAAGNKAYKPLSRIVTVTVKIK